MMDFESRSRLKRAAIITSPCRTRSHPHLHFLSTLACYYYTPTYSTLVALFSLLFLKRGRHLRVLLCGILLAGNFFFYRESHLLTLSPPSDLCSNVIFSMRPSWTIIFKVVTPQQSISLYPTLFLYSSYIIRHSEYIYIFLFLPQECHHDEGQVSSLFCSLTTMFLLPRAVSGIELSFNKYFWN